MKDTDKQTIVFAGTPDFAVPALQKLILAGHRVIGVYSQPDRPAGRGRKLIASPVKQVAAAHDIPVFQPVNFKSESDLSDLEALNPDLMVVAAYGLLLPRRVLEAPRLGCINIHASLLPRWRGAAPIQRSLLAGDGETGITIMQMDIGLDTGGMLLRKSCPIMTDDTGGKLHDRLSVLGADALMEALPGIIDQSLEPENQDEALACYAKKLDKSEARIDWSGSAQALDRQVRAFNPWPVAQCEMQGKTVRVWDSIALPDTVEAVPGAVARTSRDGIDVVTGNGLLRILSLQIPGKKATSATDFLNARSLDGVVFD
ncbi:MAG: methionyl-tRNA formyltransferase [Gammaproteobacteria bacterium]|nr:methionyl-tRNA formyltransferase [Gammaproteobacteria bacterium]